MPVGRAPGRGVEDVRREGAHASAASSRSRAIWRRLSTVSARSVASSFCSRRSSSARISSASRPAARIRKTRSNRSSYAALPASSRAAVSPAVGSTPDCSRWDWAPPRSPIRG